MPKKKSKGRGPNFPTGRPPTQPTGQSPMNMGSASPAVNKLPDRPDVVPLIQQIEDQRKSRVLAFWFDDGTQLDFGVMPSFQDQLRSIGEVDQIDLWLHSRGGATEAPWQIVQMIREHCKRFCVLIPENAHSAATHIALGANEIIMGPFSTMSPVDPQRRHPLLPTAQDGTPLSISVQDLRNTVEFIKREAGDGGLTGEAFAQVMSALFEKVHPLAIGAIEQSYALSKLVTRRMLSTHMDEDSEADAIDWLTNELSDGYHSHAFPIGLREARRLGLKVQKADNALEASMSSLLAYYRQIQVLPVEAKASGPMGQQPIIIQTGSRLDSTDLRIDGHAIFEKGTQPPKRLGGRWVKLPEA